jgi:hypothetical protein
MYTQLPLLSIYVLDTYNTVRNRSTLQKENHSNGSKIRNDRSFVWLGTGTSIKGGGFKEVVWVYQYHLQ